MNTAQHIPVLLTEVLEYLSPVKGDRVLDVTLGLGGHSQKLLEAVGTDGALVGLDADGVNLEEAKKRLSEYSHQLTLVHENFRDLLDLNLGTFDCIFADLGVSSPHFDDPERGFTFRNDAPLDMRYDQSQGRTAADLIAVNSEDELSEILQSYGEVRQGRKLAVAIKKSSPRTTTEVRTCVEDICGFRAKNVLPQVFQALRIAVNDEMGALDSFLRDAPMMLNPGGRIGILAYHSLEDRKVKKTFRALTAPEIDDHTGAISKEAPFIELSRKAIKPTEEEIQNNPRARSARLRVIKKALS